MKKQVWFNINTGEFSNSWIPNEPTLQNVVERELAHMKERGWKLIEYECKNDESFEFYNLMQVFTSKNKIA